MGFLEWLTRSDRGAVDDAPLSEDAVVQLIVGLGNPGAEYAATRHNAGFWFVDELAGRHGGRFAAERKFQGEACRLHIAGHDIRLFKPTTYMNRSGNAVRAIAAYLKVPPEKILVVHDDIDLPPGTVRLKRGGGHGGHNGLRDTIAHIGRDFARLRLGVGHPGKRDDVIDAVLGRPGREEEASILDAIGEAADLMPLLLEEGFDKAMTRLHTRRDGDGDKA